MGYCAVLVVDDVIASSHYNRDKLGFGYERLVGEPQAFCMVRRKGVEGEACDACSHPYGCRDSTWRTATATGFASATTRRGDG